MLIYQLVILLPAFYFAWYATGPYTATALAEILGILFRFFLVDKVYAIHTSGTDIVIYMQNLPRVTIGESTAAFSFADKGIVVNPFTYSYGVPLFLALAIASPATLRQYVFRVGSGLTILYAGICFSIISSIIFIMHENPDIQWPNFSADADLNDALVDYIHFVGFLLIPRILPLVIWGILYRESIREIIHSLRSSHASKGASGTPPSP